MNIFSQIKILPSLLMNNSSSIFLASDNVIASFLSSDNLFTRIARVFLQILYFSCKWIMYVVDVIYFYILQLAGVSADTSIFDSNSSDMTFKLLIDNKDTVTTMLKNFIAIAIILILVTAIIAIIKQQASSLKSGGKGNPSSDTMRSVFKSVLLIILTPLIAILGIVSSSVILQSLFSATNLSNTKSLSARVFNVSASAANKYKAYAENGVRIPIVYKFSGDDKESAIQYTAKMIGNEKFPNIDYFDANKSIGSSFVDPVTGESVETKEYTSGMEEWLYNTYYKYYDSSSDYKASSTNGSQYKVLSTHADEYFAMSDVIGYALDTMEEFYFITIQDLLESLASLSSDDAFKEVVNNYNIRLLNESSTEIATTGGGAGINYSEMLTKIKNKSGYSYIRYTTKYSSGSYDYVHVKDAVDELEGAKFIIAYKVENGGNYTKSINGDYYKNGSSYYEIDKYYLKESDSSRYKKVDIYYYYDNDKEDYVKASTFSNSESYYYKIGEDYYSISSDMKSKFYFKDENGNYKSFTYGSDTFYSLVKNYYYKPLSNGISAYEGNPTFESQYVYNNGIITARGIFDNSSYPTAIRKTQDGDISFYRDDLELVTDGSLTGVGNLDQIEAEEDSDEETSSESSEDQGFFAKVGSAVKSAWNSVKKFVSNLFNPLKLVPDLNIDESKLATTYTKKTTEVHLMTSGKLHISYFFSDSLTSKLSAKLYGMNLNLLFEPMNINYVTLVIGSIVMFKIMVTAIFGFINRAINLFILILIYPLACATIPIDEISKKQKSGSYAKWSQKYTQLLFSTYGLILAINFVFVIIPVIDDITFLKTEYFVENKALGRVANALYNPWLIVDVLNIGKVFTPNYNVIASFVNKLLRLIFQIAAFTLVTSTNGKGGDETFNTVIQTIVGTGPGALEDSPLDAVKKTLKSTTKVINSMLFPQKVIADKVKNSKEKLKSTAVSMIPGSAIAMEAVDKVKQMSGSNLTSSALKVVKKEQNNP